eukprot:15436104-Alexandrium_andersonii.AAC.1
MDQTEPLRSHHHSTEHPAGHPPCVTRGQCCQLSRGLHFSQLIEDGCDMCCAPRCEVAAPPFSVSGRRGENLESRAQERERVVPVDSRCVPMQESELEVLENLEGVGGRW